MREIIRCPECRRRLHLPEDFQGEVVRCPSCQAHFSVEPDPPTASPVTAASPAPKPKSPPPRADRGAEEDAGARERDDPGSRPRRGLPRPRSSSRGGKGASGGGWGIVLAVLGAGALVAGVGVLGILYAHWQRTPSGPPAQARARETEEERRQEVKEALANQKPLTEEELAAELKPLFEDLGGALQANDSDLIMAHFDLERMVDELAPLMGPRLRTPKEKRDGARGLGQGLGRSLAKPGALLRWKASEIRSVKKLNDDEAVVIVRHTHPNGAALKMRWWVTRRAGTWKVYDLEDLDMGLRTSTAVAAIAGQAMGDLTETARAGKTLGEALRALAVQDLDTAEKKLEQIARVKLPAQFEAIRHMAVGMLRLDRGQAQDALDALDKAHGLHPDIPCLDFLKGRAFNLLGKWDEALKHLGAYRDLLGEDAEVCRELGYALRGKERFPDAARAYRKSLDFDPKDPDAFLGLLRSLGGDDNKDDVGERFVKLDDLRENFDTFAEDCERREFPELLEPLVLAMRKTDPDYAPVDYYLALVKARTGHPDQAVPLFQSALAKQQDAELRRAYARRFLQVMASLGKGADAYAAAPDARDAFRFLAAEAMKHYRPDELRQLVTAHKKNHAADPLLPWYQAEVYVRDQRYALAEKTFAAALAKPPDADTLKSFRAGRVLARYHTGQALSAYREVGPRQETFRQLAALSFQDEDDGLLQELLDAHAKNDPESTDLLRYRYRLKIRQDRAAEGIALFKAAVAGPLPDDERAEMVSEFLGDLVRAGKPLEGYRAAPDAKEAFEIVAEELLGDGRLDDLRRLVEAHRAGHPADPGLALYQGEIHLGDKAWDKAAQVLGGGMKGAPKDMRDRFHWRFLFAMYKAGRWMRAYEETEPRDETFTHLADLLAGDKKGADLDALCKAHQAHAADDPDLLYYQALAKVFSKQPAEAGALLQKASQKQAVEARRRGYLSRFLLEMDELGLALEGYRVAPDKPAAFETLAPRLVFQKKEKELATLLAEHERGQGADRLCEFYRGELHLLRGEVEAAGRQFASALAKGLPADRWRFRDGLFRARVKAGKAAGTYQEVEPGTQTFEELASLCAREKDVKQLQALIDAHRKGRPDDPGVPAWELEVKWLNQDYEGTLKLLTERREDVFELPRFRWKARDYQVRALVRLKRTKDAIREAEALVCTLRDFLTLERRKPPRK